MRLDAELQRQLDDERSRRTLTIRELLQSAKDYANPNPGLSAEQLRHEMARISSTIDAVLQRIGQ